MGVKASMEGINQGRMPCPGLPVDCAGLGDPQSLPQGAREARDLIFLASSLLTGDGHKDPVPHPQHPAFLGP